jgi:ornithine carbamoyltransferase
MGSEGGPDRRREILFSSRVTRRLMETSERGAFFMHCPPARRGYEVDAKALDGKNSIVCDQAENRLHTESDYAVVGA